jgi:hypothetical protein
MGDRTRKLVALRARTDHDLPVLVQRELNAGFALVDAATTRNSPLFAKAEKALSTAATLLPRISGLSQDDRLRIEGKVKELRFRLDLVPAYGRSFLASVAS